MSEREILSRPVRNVAEREQKQVRTRQRGVFNGTRQRLSVIGDIPGFVTYWFNDQEGRLERAQLGGWEFVTEQDGVSVPGGNSGVQTEDLGSRFRVVVGAKDNSEPLYGYLMKLRKEWYEEDQEDIQKENHRRMQALITEDGAGGGDIENKYIPNGRKKALGMASGTFNEFSKAK